MNNRSDYQQDQGAQPAATRTCDLYLAASLVTAGLRYDSADVSQGRVYFTFSNEEGQVAELRRKYLSRSLVVDALTMGDNVKSLKSLCVELTRRDSRDYA